MRLDLNEQRQGAMRKTPPDKIEGSSSDLHASPFIEFIKVCIPPLRTCRPQSSIQKKGSRIEDSRYLSSSPAWFFPIFPSSFAPSDSFRVKIYRTTNHCSGCVGHIGPKDGNEVLITYVGSSVFRVKVISLVHTYNQSLCRLQS